MLKRGFLNSRRQKSMAEEKCKGAHASPESHKEVPSPDLSAAEVVKTLDPVDDTKAAFLAVTVDLVEEVTNVCLKVLLPHEIVFEILTRLPVKSLSRFRCVSKLWNSTFSDRRFVNSHHIRSFSRPDGTTRLITFPDGTKNIRSIYAVRENEALHLLNIPVFVASYISSSVNGLICIEEDKVIKICNPTTREFISLPRTVQERFDMDPWTGHLHVTSLGYDPLNNQHKVLNTKFIESRNDRMITEHRVLVLGGAASSSWRILLDGPPPHLPRKNDDVCFNGVIYYRAWTSMANELPQGMGSEVLAEFDVGLESFRFIQLPDGALSLKVDASALIQFDGHLAVVDYQHLRDRKTINLWVLEDSVNKPDWVCKTIVFSSAAGWTDSLEEKEFFLAGTTRTGEVIIAPYTLKKPFYLFYLDLKNACVRRVKIRKFPEGWLRLSGVFCNVTVTEHVENILSLRGR